MRAQFIRSLLFQVILLLLVCQWKISAEAQSVMTPSTARRSPVFRKAIGGTMIAVGGVLLGAAVLMTLNDYTSLTLREDESCSFSGQRLGKCYVTTPALATTWVFAGGLIGGGVAVLLDPLKLFRDTR